MVYKAEPQTNKTVEVKPILDYLKKNVELHRDLYYDKQNLQVLGMYKAYTDAYEFVLDKAIQSKLQ